MMVVTIVTQVLNLSGGLVLDLNELAGYDRVSLTAPQSSQYKFDTDESSYVDGGRLISPASLSMPSRTEIIRVKGDKGLRADSGAYWMQVEDRIEALAEATKQPFLWRIRDGGYLWTYRSVGPANVVPVSAREDFLAWRRPVTVSFLTQPNPTKAVP